jgi:hypothetical protein
VRREKRPIQRRVSGVYPRRYSPLQQESFHHFARENRPMLRVHFATVAALLAVSPAAWADVSLNNMFGDHMVLQQGIKNKVWGDRKSVV